MDGADDLSSSTLTVAHAYGCQTDAGQTPEQIERRTKKAPRV
jgi:hypothetical protein